MKIPSKKDISAKNDQPNITEITEKRVVKKIRSAIHKLGRDVVKQALTLYYTLIAAETPYGVERLF